MQGSGASINIHIKHRNGDDPCCPLSDSSVSETVDLQE